MFPNNSKQKSNQSEYWYKKVSGSFGQLYHYHSVPVFDSETNHAPEKTTLGEKVESPGTTIFAGLTKMNARVSQAS